MKNKTGYPIFTNKKNNKKLVFYPVKKNANSSSKLFFAKHLGIQDNFYFLEDEKPRFLHTKKDYEKLDKKINLMQFFVNNSKFEKVNADFKACILRNPLERFLSAYKNRIIFHKDPEFFEHSVSDVLEKLEAGLFENKHFIPQNFFLGNDLNYFNIIGETTNLNNFVKEINNFFNKEINFPRIQIGGNKENINLSNKQKEKIEKIYENDYILFENFLKLLR